MPSTHYQEEGFRNRKDYLLHLSEDYDIPLHKVRYLADCLGPSEDFKSLISKLEALSLAETCC
jgi:hypothetical protein